MTPKSPKASIKQPTWHPHYNDESADIVFLSNDGVKFGMSLKLLSKSRCVWRQSILQSSIANDRSNVFADMGSLPSAPNNQQTGEQLIDLDHDHDIVLQFLELVSVHNIDLVVDTLDFAACQALHDICVKYDCERLEGSVRGQLYSSMFDESKAWELFKYGAERDNWEMGRQGLRGMDSSQVSQVMGSASDFRDVLEILPADWQLALSTTILVAFIKQSQLVMGWNKLAPKFYKPGNTTDKETAL
jgi:hypothetical protein